MAVNQTYNGQFQHPALTIVDNEMDIPIKQIPVFRCKLTPQKQLI